MRKSVPAEFWVMVMYCGHAYYCIVKSTQKSWLASEELACLLATQQVSVRQAMEYKLKSGFQKCL